MICTQLKNLRNITLPHAVKIWRENQGKEFRQDILMTQNRLHFHVLFGCEPSKKIGTNGKSGSQGLNKYECSMMFEVMSLNIEMLLYGMSHDDRKAVLTSFVKQSFGGQL